MSVRDGDFTQVKALAAAPSADQDTGVGETEPPSMKSSNRPKWDLRWLIDCGRNAKVRVEDGWGRNSTSEAWPPKPIKGDGIGVRASRGEPGAGKKRVSFDASLVDIGAASVR